MFAASADPPCRAHEKKKLSAAVPPAPLLREAAHDHKTDHFGIAGARGHVPFVAVALTPLVLARDGPLHAIAGLDLVGSLVGRQILGAGRRDRGLELFLSVLRRERRRHARRCRHCQR